MFSDNVEWSSKKLWNIISADVETDLTKIKRHGGCILKNFLSNSKLETQCKKGVYFHLILLFIPSSLITSFN